MLYCHSCGNAIAPGAKFCPQCAAPLSQNDQNISIQDGVVGGDVHQTNITNIHHSNTQPRPYQSPEDIKLSWWGVYVTRSQYFLCYWIAIGFFFPMFAIGWTNDIPMFNGPGWLAFWIIWFIGYSIEALVMRQKFDAAERMNKLGHRK